MNSNRNELIERVSTLQRELRGLRQYMEHLETIAQDLAGYTEHNAAREVLDEFQEWLGKDYKYRNMTVVEKRQCELIGAHLAMLLHEKGL